MWFGPSLMMGAKNFVTVTALYTTSQTVSVPAGAVFADIECTGAGGAYLNDTGSEGGSWAKKTISLSGVSSIVLEIGGPTSGNGQDTQAKVDGFAVCIARGGYPGGIGHNGTANVGDVSYRGGLGFYRYGAAWNTGESYAPGGGAAGPNGNGVDAYVDTDGATYGYWIPGAGGGGDAGSGGQLYGGGNSTTNGNGRAGCARITFRG